MVLPLKNIIYDKISETNNTTDVELLKSLNDSGVEVSKKDVNKILLHLEIMNLISVRWMGKNSKRIELSKTDHEKPNALW
jgi:arginine repressor|tara:strand:+ start:1267 stop:1506 length:240 start_codon:yes stop_codon:yes gene_type:complete